MGRAGDRRTGTIVSRQPRGRIRTGRPRSALTWPISPAKPLAPRKHGRRTRCRPRCRSRWRGRPGRGAVDPSCRVATHVAAARASCSTKHGRPRVRSSCGPRSRSRPPRLTASRPAVRRSTRPGTAMPTAAMPAELAGGRVGRARPAARSAATGRRLDVLVPQQSSLASVTTIDVFVPPTSMPTVSMPGGVPTRAMTVAGEAAVGHHGPGSGPAAWVISSAEAPMSTSSSSRAAPSSMRVSRASSARPFARPSAGPRRASRRREPSRRR